MNTEIHWHQPIPLRSGTRKGLIYVVPGFEDLPRTPGVYVFGRLNRQRLIPLYVGQATRLRGRIRGQLNNARLMVGIQRSPGRRRVLVIGELVGRSRQDITAVLKFIERTLIEYATLEGYELINQMGTRPPTNTISFSGSRVARSWLLPKFTVTRPRRSRRGD